MDTARDTIAAIATGAGAGGIGIVRLSGPRAIAIARTLTRTKPRARHAHYVRFLGADGTTLDHGLLLSFPAPRSFTGEHVVELHAHGAPVVLAQLLVRCIALGARAARAGEFSERAFLNGRIDLAQAEAVADLIASTSQAQARAAVRSLDGEFSRRVDALLARLVHLRTWIEAGIDFSDEEIDVLGDARVAALLEELRADVDALLREARRGQRLRDGVHAVILGRPNAGKSSLLNALAGSERAIVTAVPGTTRDLLREAIVLDGVELTLVDTAGLRETRDEVEAEGVRRARAELARADLVLIVLDASDPAHDGDAAVLAAEAPDAAQRLWIHTKSDLVEGAAVGAASAAISSRKPAEKLAADAAPTGTDHLHVSARTGAGLDALRARLREIAAGGASEGTFSARARHVAALERVAAHLQGAANQVRETRAAELVAEELRQAQLALGEITGTFTPDDLLGSIFSSFCIGK